MTSADFLAFYPQFADIFPDVVLSAYSASANARFDEFEEDTEEARRLYVEHKLTLYAQTMPASFSPDQGGVSSFSALATSGDGTKITSKKVDDVVITYASGNSSSVSTGLSDLEETTYGLQLLSLLHLHSYPRYVP